MLPAEHGFVLNIVYHLKKSIRVKIKLMIEIENYLSLSENSKIFIRSFRERNTVSFSANTYICMTNDSGLDALLSIVLSITFNFKVDRRWQFWEDDKLQISMSYKIQQDLHFIILTRFSSQGYNSFF